MRIIKELDYLRSERNQIYSEFIIKKLYFFLKRQLFEEDVKFIDTPDTPAFLFEGDTILELTPWS